MNPNPNNSQDFEKALEMVAAVFSNLVGAATQPNPTPTEDADKVTVTYTRSQYADHMNQLAQSDKRQAEYNKLWKNYTACKNQRDSYSAVIAANQKLIQSMQEEIDRLKKVERREVPVIIVDGVAYNGEQIQQMVAAQASAKDYRKAMEDSEARWRARAEKADSELRSADAQLIAANSSYAHEHHLRKHYQADLVKLGRENAALKRTMAENRGCDINKMRKDLTAERSRNRSYETTIAELRYKVKELEDKIAATAPNAAATDNYVAIILGKPYTRADLEALVRAKPPVDTIIINGISYSAEDVARVINTSCERAETIKELIEQRAKILTTSAERADIINQLTAQRNDAVRSAQQLAEQVHVYTYQGRDLSHDEVSKYIDLGIAAEKAGLTVGYMNALNSVPAKTHLPTTVIVENPDEDFVRLKYPDRTLDLAAKLIPQMVDDVNQLRTQVSNYEEREKLLARRNRQQANSVRAAEEEIEKLRKRVDDLSKTRAENAKTIHQLQIERNLLRGRLNDIAKPVTVNGQAPQPGEAYMTTALGLLPINSTGMRQLSDALSSYRARVQNLTAGLREWIKE